MAWKGNQLIWKDFELIWKGNQIIWNWFGGKKNSFYLESKLIDMDRTSNDLEIGLERKSIDFRKWIKWFGNESNWFGIGLESNSIHLELVSKGNQSIWKINQVIRKRNQAICNWFGTEINYLLGKEIIDSELV